MEVSAARMIREKKTIRTMVGMYCAGHHKVKIGLCQECASLLDYAGTRLDKCPFGGKKPACAKCTIHCYNPSMRAKITAVMKYSGPRIMLKHPILALLHGMKLHA